MGDFNKEICRLCLETSPTYECETINENEEKLKVLLINIDFNISDDAVACMRCLERLQECFEFKSRITTLVGVDMKVEVENLCLENTQVCQLCMSLLQKECFSYTTDCKDAVLLKDMIKNCLPETDLDAVREPLICKHCLSSLKKYYELMESCKEVERRIERFCQETGHGAKSRVDFRDMLKFKDCTELDKPIIMKKECSDVGFVDVNIMKCVNSEEIEAIKYEEIDIKDELYNGMDVSNSEHLEDLDGFEDDGSSIRKENIMENESKGNKYFWRKCPYSSRISSHMQSHNEVYKEVYKCILCPFTTDTRLSLTAHTTIHKGTTKAFGCKECPYETDLKGNLVQHLLKHKDISEVESHKCSLCSYKSKYKSDIAKHYRRTHVTNITMQKCNECSFVTKYRENLVRHQLRHKNPEEIPKHKCDQCEYESRDKRCLRRHMFTHQNLQEESKHKCGKCSYWANLHVDLKKHMVIHFEEHVYSCDVCSYSSNVKRNLLRHKKRIHQNGERPTYKCKLCNYQAKTSTSIRDHTTKTHTLLSEKPKLRCPHCPYEASLKQPLARHIRRQHTSKDKPMLKCASCNYMTQLKEDLRNHMLVHQDATLQCDQCSFRTKHKSCLRIHMYLHDPSKRPLFQCDQCEYNTSRKWRLSLHQTNHTMAADTVIYYCATCDFNTKYKESLRGHVKGCLKKKRNNDKT